MSSSNVASMVDSKPTSKNSYLDSLPESFWCQEDDELEASPRKHKLPKKRKIDNVSEDDMKYLWNPKNPKLE